MAKITTLKKKGETIYPRTKFAAVYGGQEAIDAVQEAIDDVQAQVDTKQTKIVIEVGSAQTTFDGKVFPRIPIATAKDIYDTYVAGNNVIIRWKVMGTVPVEATIVGSDYVAGVKSFTVLIHSNYSAKYSFTDSQTTGYADSTIEALSKPLYMYSMDIDFRSNLDWYMSQPGDNIGYVTEMSFRFTFFSNTYVPGFEGGDIDPADLPVPVYYVQDILNYCGILHGMYDYCNIQYNYMMTKYSQSLPTESGRFPGLANPTLWNDNRYHSEDSGGILIKGYWDDSDYPYARVSRFENGSWRGVYVDFDSEDFTPVSIRNTSCTKLI